MFAIRSAGHTRILKIVSRRADRPRVAAVPPSPTPTRWAHVDIVTSPTGATGDEPPLDAVLDAELVGVLAGQRLVRSVTERLLHAGPDELDREIGAALESLGEFLEIDRVYVFTHEGATIRNSHEWCAAGISPEIDNLQEVPIEFIDVWMESFLVGAPLVIPDVPDLPRSRADRETLVSQGILSLVAVPLSLRHEIVGFVGFDAVRSHRIYTPFEIGLLQWLADVLATAVVRQRSDTKAELAERRLAALTRYAIDFILILGEDTRIRFASDSWSTIGLAPDTTLGTSWFDYVHTDDAPALLELAQQVVVSSRHEQVMVLPDFRVRTGDGSWRWFSGSMSDVRHDGVVDGIVVNLHDVTERRAVQVQLAHDALHDPLTGLGNRAMLAEELAHVCRRARRERTSVGLVFLDLDRFKLVNDGHGHSVGDQVLVEVGRRISTVVRSSDAVIRLGGDEFVVLLDGFDDVDEVDSIVVRLERVFEPPIVVDGNAHRVAASMGVVLGQGESLDPVALLRDADSAMYRAKEEGRGRVVVFDESIRSRVLRRLALVQRLPDALRTGALTMAFQSVIDLRSGRVVGAEALARWFDDQLGPVSPTEFVPIVEEVGHVTALTELAIGQSLAALAGWEPSTTVSVNLALSQLVDPDLVAVVASALDAHHVDPARLCIEVTESTLMVDPPRLASILDELRRLGVRTALDDFGTGYSSLAVLRELPIDLLKIDRVFVRRVHLDDRDRRLVDAVISLAQDFAMETVAEGVELPEQRQALIDAGCHYAQGFLFGRAVPAEEFAASLL